MKYFVKNVMYLKIEITDHFYEQAYQSNMDIFYSSREKNLTRSKKLSEAAQ